MSADLLIEIGTEELPPKALHKLGLAFRDGIARELDQRQFARGELRWFATPRRLAVIISDLAAQAPDEHIELQGPPVNAARDAAGNWSKAAEGFARKNGVAPEQLTTVATDKGDKLCFRSVRPGDRIENCLATVVEQALAQLPVPKRMRWGSSKTEFVRPLHWVVLLYGAEVLPLTVMGLTANNLTRGHRFHCDTFLPIANPGSYEKLLAESGHVIAHFDQRRAMIADQVSACGQQLGGAAVIDPELLDEVTALVEWPVALAGQFEQRFLDVPAEALISSMKEHQKYFHVVDSNAALMPHFITVANISSAQPDKVVAGNERVIRPRLSDAAFFFDTDRKTPLAGRRDKLKSIVFQEKLGTLFDKTARVATLAEYIARQLGSDPALAARAGELAKNDLVTDMVLEFDTMQGIAGEYYARHDGEPDEVARAIREQYLPRFAGDQLPASTTGCALALADRLDTLVGIFGIGQPPTGSKDPFALRRASLGVLRIIVEQRLPLDLRDLLQQAVVGFNALPAATGLVDTVLGYMLERFRAWYEEARIPVEVLLAVTANPVSAPLDIDQRVQAVHQFYQLPEAAALAAANKRVANILAGVDSNTLPDQIDPSLLADPAEQALAAALAETAKTIAPLLETAEYTRVLSQLARLREPVDHFFDGVMVMVDDPALRNNRLALLQQLRNQFLHVADISLLVTVK